MRILDKYINNSIIKIFISTLFIFCFLYIFIDITSTLDEIIDRKIPIKILVQYYIYFLPIIISQITPAACLIAVIFTFSGLNNKNEIIALRSSGLNFWQITKPALIFGILVSVLVFWLNEKYVPKATLITQKIRNENMILKADRILKKQEIKDLTFYGYGNRIYYIALYNPKTYDLKGIDISEFDKNQHIKKRITALKGIWTGIAWKFFNCNIELYNPEKSNMPIKVKVYKEKLMKIKETPQDFVKQRLNVSAMNLKQLREFIEKFSKSGATRAINERMVDYYHKISYPFASFFVVLISLPFSIMIKSRKHANLTSLFIAVCIGFLFYVTDALSIAFGKGGVFPPLLAAWIAPLLFTGIAIILIESQP